MKKVGLLFINLMLLLGFTSCVSMVDSGSTSHTATAQGTYKGSLPFIFVERGVEFAIYPNGEFDFAYVGDNYQYNPYNGPRRPFSFNGGYNYDMYLQFDRYGAVVQVESVPIYYDSYGRVSQIGNIRLKYYGDYVGEIGNMHIIYENNGVYMASSGYVNSYNQNFRPQPWHAYYARPYYNVIYTQPYRENYRPKRYKYEDHRQRYENRGRSNYDNGRRTFVDPATQTTRRSDTDNRRENVDNPRTPDRGRDNTSQPKREPTKGTNTGRRGESSKTPSKTAPKQESTRRGESSNKQQNTKRRESTTPTNNRRKEAPAATQQSNNRRETTTQPTNTRRENNTSRGRSSNTPTENSNNRR